MPWWDEPEITDEIAAMVDDLAAVDGVLADLPHGCRDWHLADCRSIDISDRLDGAVGRAERSDGTPGVSTPPPELIERAHRAIARSAAVRGLRDDAAGARGQADQPLATRPRG